MNIFKNNRQRINVALPLGVLLAGLALSLAGGWWLGNDVETRARAEFERGADRIKSEITRRFRQPIYGLNGAKAMYAASASVKRAEFRAFVASRNLASEFPGVRGLGFMQSVKRDDLPAFVAAERADGAPEFKVMTLDEAPRDELLVIKFIEPLVNNLQDVGLDVASEARRRAGAQMAIDTGEPAITEAISLVQANQATPGVLLFAPVYAQGAPQSNVAERRASVLGLAYAPIVIRELLDHLPDVQAERLNVELFDSADGTPADRLIFDAGKHLASFAAEKPDLQDRKFQTSGPLALAGRTLSVRISSTPKFEAAVKSASPALLVAGGLLASLLLSLVIWQQASGRRRAEALASQMTADLDRLALVARKTSNAVIISDAAGRITWANAGFERLSGYTAAEYLGASPGELLQFEESDPEVRQRMGQAVRRGEPFSGEILNRSKHGRIYWLELEIQPLRDADGLLTGFMAIQTDINDRKKAEHDMLHSDLLLRGVMDVIDEGFVLHDPDDRLVFCNEKYRQIYADVADLLVPGAKFEDIIRAGAQRGSYSAALGRVDDWVAERMAIHSAGNTALEQRHENGTILRIVEQKMPGGHIVGFRFDITELVRSRENAMQASVAKSQFLANISHELRTPMNAILGMMALLGNTGLSPRQADYTAKSESAARSLLGLLDEILDFSKIEAGKMTMDPRPFRMDQLLRGLAVSLTSNLGSKDIEMLFDIDPQLPRTLVGDALQLQRILINLCSNAIKFTESGEVVLSVTVNQLGSAQVTLTVAVRDTGIGIAPEHQARIFSGFTQAEASTTRRFGGTGLGVAISQRFVSMMGGELKLESALGEGSRFFFTLTLPLATSASPKLSDEPAADPRPLLASQLPWRALVVDDHPTARELLARMGQSSGWSVDVADSGERALTLLEEGIKTGMTYQAVFIDWQMPGMDGWETCQRIRELDIVDQALVIVMVTAHGRDALAQRSQAEQSVLDGFLVKPITASMMFDAVINARSAKDQPHPSRQMASVQSQRLSGLRLLLVEDNLVNQQVACELLQSEGASVQVANQGQEALDALVEAPSGFDVVLMDLQMPVMDGFIATRHIREVLGLNQLPIVAMTANAMLSDREACLAAGMNDHVGKPFNLNQLVQLLRKLGGLQDVPGAAPAMTEQTLPLRVVEAAREAQVDINAALDRIGGKQDVYQRMLRSFVNDIAVLPAQLGESMARGEHLSASRLLHTLKGLSATLGMTALAAQAAQSEKDLANDNASGQQEVVMLRISEAIQAAMPALQVLHSALQHSQAPDPAPHEMRDLDPDALVKALQVMDSQLLNSDMAATETMSVVARQFGPALGSQLQDLNDAVDALDFEGASKLCREIIGRQGR